MPRGNQPLRGESRDDAFCFEIFQRAIVQREDAAWAAIVAQYRGIVLAYVGQHTVATLMHEPDDYWVNRAFQRFWSAVGADRFAQFPDLAALLKYLKLCVHSVLMDEVRARRGGQLSSLDEVPETAAARDDAEHSVRWPAGRRRAVGGHPARIAGRGGAGRGLPFVHARHEAV